MLEVHLLLPKPGTGPPAHIHLCFPKELYMAEVKRYSEGHYCPKILTQAPVTLLTAALNK